MRRSASTIRPAAVVVAAAMLLGAMACDTSNPAQPTPACAFGLSSRTQSFASEGGPGTVTVDTDPRCEWTVEGASGWVTLQSAVRMTGPGTVQFAVMPNAAVDGREKALTIAGLAFNITQSGQAPCEYGLAPESQSFGEQGGRGQVQVTTVAGCPWSGVSHANWITIDGDGRGSGPGVLGYVVTENSASTSRSGSLTIAGRTFAITQAGEEAPGPEPLDCEYTVGPVTLSPCMAGGTLTASLTTTSNCSWTVATSDAWLSLPGGGSGKGSATLAIAYPDNYDAPRHGVVMVRWPTPTAGQNIHVEQAGCLYSVSQSAFSFTSASSSGSFNVLQQSVPNTCGGPLQDRCVWSAVSDVPWIAIAGSMPRQGDQLVSFTVAANTGASSRTGRIAVRNQVVTITQAAP